MGIQCWCRYCRRTFTVTQSEANAGRGHFCSWECVVSERRKNNVTRRCLSCSKALSVPFGRFKRGLGKYCSRDCKETHKNAEISCENCGIIFVVTRYAARKRRFCNHQCANAFNIIKAAERMDNRACPCGVCGSPVKRYPSQFAQGNGKYCSWLCKSEARRDRIRVRCVCCGREVIKIKSNLSRLNFCDQRCSQSYLRDHPVRLRYTPELLAGLLGQGGTLCSFPGCFEPRVKSRRETARWNPWGLCRLHAKRVYTSLHMRQKYREAIIEQLG